MVGGSEGHSSQAVAVALALLASVASLFATLYQDEPTVLGSWAVGSPKLVIRLEVPVPVVDAERCAVAVLRLAPRRAAVYVGKDGPGETVVVREHHDRRSC